MSADGQGSPVRITFRNNSSRSSERDALKVNPKQQDDLVQSKAHINTTSNSDIE